MKFENEILAYNKLHKIIKREQTPLMRSIFKSKEIPPVFLDSTKILSFIRMMEIDLTDRVHVNSKELNLNKAFILSEIKNLN